MRDFRPSVVTLPGGPIWRDVRQPARHTIRRGHKIFDTGIEKTFCVFSFLEGEGFRDVFLPMPVVGNNGKGRGRIEK